MNALVLYVFHGSSGAEAQEALETLTNKLNKAHSNAKICFLKNQTPSLNEALMKAVQAGIKEIKVLPMFLLPGSHVTNDIPSVVKGLLASNPALKITIDDCLIKDKDFLNYLIKKL
jgi:sirohydrochlorin ferrochelatase